MSPCPRSLLLTNSSNRPQLLGMTYVPETVLSALCASSFSSKNTMHYILLFCAFSAEEVIGLAFKPRTVWYQISGQILHRY